MARRISSPVFVGRRAELQQLDEAFARAAEGHPSLVLVGGEAGVGKSRLVAELTSRVTQAGGWALTGGCVEVGEGGLPYAPIAQALREMAHESDAELSRRILGPSSVELGWLLPGLQTPAPVARDESAAFGRHARLLDAILATLGRAAVERPLVLVLEDLHWAEGSTRDLLQFMVRNLRDERLLIVGTYRSDDLHRRHPLRPLLSEMERSGRVERLDIHRFDRTELAELLSGIIGEAPSATLVDRLLERSDGLPFYVEELVADGEPSGPMPATLREVLDQRLSSLSDASLAMLRAAAVIGGRFDDERLEAVADMDGPALEAALREAIEARIVVPVYAGIDPSAYVFRHALLREAAMDQLLPTERVRLHVRLADHLERLLQTSIADDPALIADFALHVYDAHDQPRALEASVRALGALVAATAYPEAFNHAERALELWPRVVDAEERAGMDHVSLLRLAARVAAATRAPARAVALSQTAIRELDTSGLSLRQAELLVELYVYAWEAEDFETAAEVAQRAYDLVADGPPSSLKSYALRCLGESRWWENRLVEAAALLDEAAAIAEQVDDRQAWADATASLAHTLADLGHAERAAVLADRTVGIMARPDARGAGLMAATDRAIAFWTAGRFEDALQEASIGLDAAIRYGWQARSGSVFRSMILDALFELGRYDEAEAEARLVLAEESAPLVTMWIQQTLTRTAIARGRPEIAHRLAVDLRPSGSIGWADAWQSVVLAEIARADGRFDDVIQAVEEAAAVSPEGSVSPRWMLLGIGVGAAADRAVAARLRRRSADVQIASACAGRWLAALRSIVAVADSNGGAGRFVEATIQTAAAEWSRLLDTPDVAGWTEARSRWAAMAHPYMTAYTSLRLGEALLRTDGGRQAVETVFREAYTTAARIGADGLVAEIEALALHGRLDIGAAALAVSQSSAEAGSRAPVSLTSRERDVLRLVVQGHTNREVGDRLFISEKTASVHVSNAMAKLGALSRYEAAARATDQGLLD